MQGTNALAPPERACYRVRWSEVIRTVIVGKVCGKTEGQVAMPACGPVAQARGPSLIKPVFGEDFISKDADPGEMVLDCLELNLESRMASPTR
jgi:hypothetical protein